MYKNILVATDGSGPSVRAVDAAIELVRVQAAKLVVVTVAYVPEEYLTDLAVGLQDAVVDAGRQILEDAKKRVAAADVAAEYRLVTGEKPAEAIVDLVRHGRFDLVVMGRHGTHASTVKPLGGVSGAVLTSVACAALVVP